MKMSGWKGRRRVLPDGVTAFVGRQGGLGYSGAEAGAVGQTQTQTQTQTQMPSRHGGERGVSQWASTREANEAQSGGMA
jgi:hypothetical protein